MIRIGIVAEHMRSPHGHGSVKNAASSKRRTYGMLGTRYRFVHQLERCIAAFRAMEVLPCDANLLVRVENGKATVEGEIVAYMEDSIALAQFAAATIESEAMVAAATSPRSSTELRLTQSWTWQ